MTSLSDLDRYARPAGADRVLVDPLGNIGVGALDNQATKIISPEGNPS